jgi:VanZ family protein
MVHFSLFFGLNILLLKPFKKLNYKYYLWAPVLSVSLGLLLEYTQHFISISRSSDVYDFLANVTGIAAASLFYHFFVSNKKWEILF